MGLLQQLRKHLIYPFVLNRSGDSGQLRWLREFERTQYLNSDQLCTLQEQRLRALLVHSWENSPGYRQRFQNVGLTLSDLYSFSLEQIAQLPVLEKKDLQEHHESFVAQNWPRHDLIANQTGGSTGTPVPFYLSHDRRRSRAAATIRHNRWAGWDIGDRLAVLWGAPQDAPAKDWKSRVRNRLLGDTLWLDTGHVTEESLETFHRQLIRFRPIIIQAYARSLLLFAQFLDAQGWKAYQPESIVISAEGLEPEERTFVEHVFGCPVFNRYGCREVSVIASECSEKLGLHVMAEGLYVEIVHGDRPAEPGQMGGILVTDLLNHAMPLIRYRIGDMGTWAPGHCSCGRGLPRLEQVQGRVTDFLVGCDGRLVSGVFLATYVIAQRPGLGQVQIQQTRKGEVVFRIRPGQSFAQTEDFAYLDRTAKRYLGEQIQVRFELVSELPRESSGKFLFSRSTVAAEMFGGVGSKHRSPIDMTGSPV